MLVLWCRDGLAYPVVRVGVPGHYVVECSKSPQGAKKRLFVADDGGEETRPPKRVQFMERVQFLETRTPKQVRFS